MLENIFGVLHDPDTGLFLIVPDCSGDPPAPPPGFRKLYPRSNGWFERESTNGIISRVLATGDKSVSASTVLASTDPVIILVDTTGGDVIITLPPIATARRVVFECIRETSGGNKMTIAADGSETINGEASIRVNQQFETRTLYGKTTGTDWRLIF